MSSSSVYVAGVGMIPFVKPGANAPYHVMGTEATRLALSDAGLDYGLISRPMSGMSMATRPAASARFTRSE
jgi:sterol carrier protein 2